MKSAFDLAGKVAVVTGGNGGIGLGMAVAWPRLAPPSSSPGATRRKRGGCGDTERWRRHRPSVVVDVNDEKQCAAMVAHAVRQHGRLDILINAGIRVRKPPHDLGRRMTLVLNTNLTSAICAASSPIPR